MIIIAGFMLLVWFMLSAAGVVAIFKSRNLMNFVGWLIGTTVLCSVLGGLGFMIAIIWGIVWSHKSNKHNESTK